MRKNGSAPKNRIIKIISIFLICMMLVYDASGCSYHKKDYKQHSLMIYFVRHGQTDTNTQGLMVGQSGNPELTDQGKEDAFKLGQGLAGIEFNAVYCSELSRTYETAQLILKGADENIEIVQNGKFDDISWGDAEGMTWDQISEKYNVSDMEQCFGKLNDSKFQSPMNAESTYEFCNRFGEGIYDVIKHTSYDDHVLIVAHSSLAFYLQKLFPDKNITGVDNTSVTIVRYDFDSSDFELIDLNDTSYLDDKK